MGSEKNSKKKQRLLDRLVLMYPDRDRQWLYARIMHGDALVDGHVEKDSSRLLPPQINVELLGISDDQQTHFIGRGARKLAPVLEEARKLGFAYQDRVLLDAGAATGGFTHALLEAGAGTVHAVDLGYNLLDYRLRSDARVIVRERCNIMSLQTGDLTPQPNMAVADLSFRSMEGVATHILGLLSPHPIDGKALLLALIKPQFEFGYGDNPEEGFDGVIRDDQIRNQVLSDTRRRLEARDVQVVGSWPAGVAGAKGNREVFFLLSSGRDS